MDYNKYLQHLPECNTIQDWTPADQAMADTPDRFRDESYYAALEEMKTKRNTCTCGLENFKSYLQTCEKKLSDMEAGRHYLMSVQADKITVEDALESFGLGRDGMQSI